MTKTELHALNRTCTHSFDAYSKKISDNIEKLISIASVNIGKNILELELKDMIIVARQTKWNVMTAK